PLAEFSAIENGPPVGAGGSLTLVTLMVTVVVPTRLPAPLSVAVTVKVKVGFVSKSTAAELATVISPVEGLIAKAPPVLPSVIAQVCVSPASGSFASTVPTEVPLAEFSAIENGPPVGTGASFALVTLIVTVVVPTRLPAPLSVAVTVSVKVGLVSKSTAAELATVISPVVGLIAKAPPVLPSVI